MHQNHIYILIVLALSTLATAHSGCVHDQVAVKPKVDLHESVDPDTAGHRLLTANVGGLRIAFDVINVQASANVYNYIKFQLMPAAVNYFFKTLKVQRLNKLRVPQQYLEMCGINAPAKYVTEGVDADMLLLVEGAYEPNAGYVAWARACNTLSSTGRPYVGQVHFNLAGLMPSSDFEFTKDLLATMHEMTHALGFSSEMFQTYRHPVRMGTVNIAGYPTQYLDVEPLTSTVRKYFNCPSAHGGYLENQGGSGSAGSHWERRVFGAEYMTASQMDDFRISQITLSLLESTGWYTPDYSMAEPLVYGRQEGCGFLNSYCISSYGQPRFSEYCTNGATGCTAEGRSGAYCGADSFSDNCPYMQGYSNSDCENPASMRTIAAESHGVGSKCFMGSLYPSGAIGRESPYCFKHKCIANGNGFNLQIIVGGTTVTCTGPGKQSVNGYYGTITCPEPNKYCAGAGKEYCRRGCMGKGTCQNNKCVCVPGWGSYDCSKRTGGAHLAESPSFTYNNIPSALVDDYIPNEEADPTPTPAPAQEAAASNKSN
jgi:hypothetical protein